VLLVDEHEDELSMYAIGLSATGFQTIAVKNARDGFAHACINHPDVIVTELLFTGASGLELIRRVRHDRRTKHMCIVVLTARPTLANERAARDAGCDHYRAKPCLPSELAGQISDALAARPQSSA
jgi:DNA-binding response OmpR family regulator